MAYRVSGSLIVHKKGSDIVIDEERVSTSAELGLQIVISRMLERLTTTPTYAPSTATEITILAWAEPSQSCMDGQAEMAVQRIKDAQTERINPYLTK